VLTRVRSVRLLLVSCGLLSVTRLQSAQILRDLAEFAPDEERVIDAAIALWTDLLPATIDINVQITKAALPHHALATASGFGERNGLPTGGSITLDDRVGDFFGWFIDPTPFEAEEFQPTRLRHHYLPRTSSPAFASYDLFSVVSHELAHVLGFTSFYSGFASRIDTSADLRRYVGKDVTAVLTNKFEGTHLSDGFHPNDLLNPVPLQGHRYYPSALDLAILHDAYAYGQEVKPVPEPDAAFVVGCGLLFIGALRMHGRSLR
jgi:large repetitive protein